MQTRSLVRRLGPVVACGVLAAGVTACGSGSGSSTSGPSHRTTTAVTAAPATTPAPTTAPIGAGGSPTSPGPPSSGRLSAAEQQLAAVPGLLQLAQDANSAADPDQARAAEGG